MSRASWHIIILIFALVACSEPKANKEPLPEGPYELLSPDKFVAGESIVLIFSGQPSEQLLLLINNAWGTNLLVSTPGQGLEFELPNSLSQKAGLFSWQLLAGSSVVLQGESSITPANTAKPILETYIGPPSIFANGLDQSMLVALPQDQYGNAMQDSTLVRTRVNFRNQFTDSQIPTRKLIAYDYIDTRSQTGELFIAASVANQVSKELSVRVLASLPMDFEIEALREHAFADGNQIVSLLTSAITDSNGNMIADGTLVNFQIKNSQGSILQARGQTVNGIARAGILHPQQKDSWEISAHITGMAQSDAITLTFETAVADFALRLSEAKNQLLISGIQSYMDQLIPDGLLLSLSVLDTAGNVIHNSKTRTYLGRGSFQLPFDSRENPKLYRVTAGGITKEIEQ